MLITRTPLRISLGGGGTDLPSYYRRFGGLVISAAIDSHVYIGINRTFTDDYFLKYASLERVRTVDEIDHPIIRSALQLHPIGPSLEIVSLADIPAGTGLGSSGTFTVGLLRALHAHKREPVTAGDLAEEACHVEIDMLGRPSGKQDQYIASFGGITCLEIEPDGRVHVSPLSISTATLHDLEEHLLMFFTGYSRRAEELLDDQRRRTDAGDESMIDALRAVEQVGVRIRTALEEGDTAAFGTLMHEHWLRKRERSQGMSRPEIDDAYDAAIANGAVGGKLTGAGGGGFLVVYAADPKSVRKKMAELGLPEVRFGFDHDGSTLLVRE
ncbi:MAG: galactokinase [Chloroflexi bacterium]|nr:MAG: galactokinase [Chloroflexota bacterium]